MGIPSYYKRLCDELPGLLTNINPSNNINWLWIDFNCMIYHCLQREDTDTYPVDATINDCIRIVWENKLIYSIENYLERVVKLVRPTDGIFVGVDGVVPLAKMRQQRQRRFKAAWERNLHGEIASWDKNAITPGTDFMRRLCSHLAVSKKFAGRKYVFSGVEEAGEGEHKIMDAWRKMGTGNKVCNNALYGLDADLIVLSMLNRKYIGNVWLFREDVKDGKIQRKPDGEEQFIWFDIQNLEASLREDVGQNMVHYLFSMTTLGNDFLPGSLSLKLREDGHAKLCEILRHFTKKDIGIKGLLKLFKSLANDEERRITKYIERKISQGTSIGVETGLGEKNWPIARVWQDEGLLMTDERTLCQDWEDKYHMLYFHYEDRDRICREYIKGLQWTWNYYRGVSQEDRWSWFYPWHMPPLWKWLVKYLDKYEFSQLYPDSASVSASAPPPIPVEQLTLVLPIESWHLIPCARHRKFQTRAPWYFPKRFKFFSHGRRYFWECEADIPIPTIEEIRKTIGHTTIRPTTL